jgi:hypothetical protein
MNQITETFHTLGGKTHHVLISYEKPRAADIIPPPGIYDMLRQSRLYQAHHPAPKSASAAGHGSNPTARCRAGIDQPPLKPRT